MVNATVLVPTSPSPKLPAKEFRSWHDDGAASQQVDAITGKAAEREDISRARGTRGDVDDIDLEGVTGIGRECRGQSLLKAIFALPVTIVEVESDTEACAFGSAVRNIRMDTRYAQRVGFKRSQSADEVGVARPTTGDVAGVAEIPALQGPKVSSLRADSPLECSKPALTTARGESWP